MKKRLLAGHMGVLLSLAFLLAMQLAVSAQPVMAHRYSFFNEADGATNAMDVVGTNNGTLFGDADISGGQLQLDGNAYVGLEAGIITNDLAVTVEVWGDYPPLADQGGWANLFNFGKGDTNPVQDSFSISFCMNTLNPAADLDAAISDTDNANAARDNCFAPASLVAGGMGQHIVAVFNPPGGYIAIYVNGQLAAKFVPTTQTITPGVQDVHNWIGKDNWPDPPLTASLDEFRVWNGALNGLEVAGSYYNGFTNVNTNAGTIATITVTVPPQLTLGGQEAATVLATTSLITNSIDISDLATITSSPTNIIYVDSTGSLHAAGLGSATITASYGGVSNMATVSVVEPVSVLAHRYSFSNPVSSSNTVADSVGTLWATLEGNAVESGGSVVLDGSDATYIDLSSNSFANDGLISGFPSATIDFWATFGTMGNWSYAWSLGSEPSGFGGANFLYFAANNGNAFPQLDKSSSGDVVVTRGHYSDTTVHCTTVIDPGSGIMTLYTNGVLSGFATGDFKPLSLIDTNCIYFGRSLWTDLGPPYADGDPYLPAGSSFQEIRIYNGALTPAQIALQDQNGPNNTNIDLGALTSVVVAPTPVEWLQTTPVPVLVSYANLSNFNVLANSAVLPTGMTLTSSDTNVLPINGIQATGVSLGSSTVTVTYQGFSNSATISVVRPPAAVLMHRYSFNDGTPNDSVGTANGTLVGSASISGGQLILPNTTSASPGLDYLQLPDGIITNSVTGVGTNENDPSVTVEAWATILPNQYTWAEIFDFGNTDGGGLGEYDIHVSLHAGNGDTYIGISDSDNANIDYQFEDVPGGSKLDGNTNLYIAAVFNPPAGYLAIYTNGVLYGENHNITITMAGVWAPLNKVGADLWPDGGMQGSVDEFRIYNGVLTPDQIAADQVLGPNQLSATGVSLTASVSAGNILISWPVAGSGGLSLFSSPVIGSGAVWTQYSGPISVVGGNNQASIATGGAASQFYRLKN